MFRCCSKFSFIAIASKEKKIRAIVPDANFFKPIVFKFKTFFLATNSKIMYNLYMHGKNTPPIGDFFFLISICLERNNQNA